MSLRWAGSALAALLIAAGIGGRTLIAQEPKNEALIENTRHTRSKVQPQYPELARKMNLSGTVKVQVVVSPNGTVKEAKVIGGHPVLANAALDAVRKWRFEPAAIESSGLVDIKFEGHQ